MNERCVGCNKEVTLDTTVMEDGSLMCPDCVMLHKCMLSESVLKENKINVTCSFCGCDISGGKVYYTDGLRVCGTCYASRNEPITEYENFYKAIDESCEHMKKLIREKNTGYAQTGEGDPYCNFRWPDVPTVLAIYEGSKLSRLRGFVNNGGSKADAFEIFRDIAGYALIGMAWLKDEEGFKEGE